MAHPSQKPKVVAILGATTSGKTALSISLAREFAGEVISADSRQVYTGLDIGTGKVTESEMAGIPHHLLDMVPPTEIYTGQKFTTDAHQAISGILERNHLPIIAGGTFFYVDLLRGKMQSAPVQPNQDFRASLETYTNEELLELLQTKDSRRAETIDPHNRRRLIRALEIIDTLGTIPESKPAESAYEWLIIGLDTPKDTLISNFKRRLDAWLDMGLLAEVEYVRSHVSTARFLELGFEYTLTAEYIDGRITKEELYEKFTQKNWQYAKRQMTWLKRDTSIHWFDHTDADAITASVKKFLAS